MAREDSFTRKHILEVTENMLQGDNNHEVHIEKIATKANVAVPTIYYHFRSREQLIAEAQANAYFKLTEPLHQFLASAESAIESNDPDRFESAIGDNVVLAWTFGQNENGWKLQRMLLDIWSDPTTQLNFCELLDRQLSRWFSTIEKARRLGWISEDIDVMALITTCWTGSIGQAIFSRSRFLDYTPSRIREFYLNVVKVKDPNIGVLISKDAVSS